MTRLQLRHILCPIDLSPMSMTALRWANSMARARAAELRAFHVMLAEGATIPERLGYLERDRHMAKLREALASVDSTNDRTGAAVRQGDPGAQILQFASLLPADLTVMGAAGAERPERPVGSVTATVVARSQCPVLIVPAGQKINPGAPGLFKRIVCAVDLAPASVSVIRQAVSLARETRGLVTCAPPRRWTSTTQAVLARSVCPVLVTHDVRPLPYPVNKGNLCQTVPMIASAR